MFDGISQNITAMASHHRGSAKNGKPCPSTDATSVDGQGFPFTTVSESCEGNQDSPGHGDIYCFVFLPVKNGLEFFCNCFLMDENFDCTDISSDIFGNFVLDSSVSGLGSNKNELLHCLASIHYLTALHKGTLMWRFNDLFVVNLNKFFNKQLSDQWNKML